MSAPHMPLRKRITRHPMMQTALCAVFAGYIRLVRFTCREMFNVPEASRRFITGEEQCICAFWHGRMFLMPTLRPKSRPMHVLISGHRDGVLISRVIRFFGIDTVVGSSSKGSLAALRAIKQVLQRGDNLSVTPDGPRGPNRVAAPGIIYAAQISGLPIVPVSFSAVSMKHLKSWDRFSIPLPFTRVAFIVAEPIIVPRTMTEAEMETYRQHIEQVLNRITDEADALTGRLQRPVREEVVA